MRTVKSSDREDQIILNMEKTKWTYFIHSNVLCLSAFCITDMSTWKPKPQAAKNPLWNLWLLSCFFFHTKPGRGCICCKSPSVCKTVPLLSHFQDMEWRQSLRGVTSDPRAGTYVLTLQSNMFLGVNFLISNHFLLSSFGHLSAAETRCKDNMDISSPY